MAKRDQILRNLILQLVPADGSSVGNKALLQQLGEAADFDVTEQDYSRIRDALIAEGLLVSGRGRGGSVKRANGAGGAESESGIQADDFSLAPQELPHHVKQPASKQQGILLHSKGQGKVAAPVRKSGETANVVSYRHNDKRKNNPHVGMVDTASDGVESETRWAYDPHIDPALNFDPARAGIETLIDDALASGDPAQMRAALEQLKRMQAPYLNWTGKAERTSFEVDLVSLHVHERIDPATILAAVQKRMKNPSSSGRGAASHPSPSGRGAGVRAERRSGAFQPDLFSAPFENLPLRDAIEFYKHDRDWANRLIAGDSLLVMNSLIQKESMAGQVQMIYIDPPYGIKYGSNFQPFVNKRKVEDRKDEDLTQEPEMIKAFRDTWELGIHSYLTYLRDRLLLAKELLHESGSVFVQISDENLHLVRNVLDEIFGPTNFVRLISIQKTSTAAGDFLPIVSDYLLWYARDASKVKAKMLYVGKVPGGVGGTGVTHVRMQNGAERRLTRAELADESKLSEGARMLGFGDITSSKPPGSFPVDFEGRTFLPNKRYWSTGEEGMRRLISAGRVQSTKNGLSYRRYFDDFSVFPLINVWTDTVGQNQFGGPKAYVVQTALLIVERCIVMTTDPGDLVLDPTCGSGTTAFVAEKWGRRWITCDTSRVAVTLAKQRLMTASYDYYELKYPHEGLRGGFIYKTVPHVTLKSIANNPEIDEIYARMHPAVEAALVELNKALLPSPAGGRGVGGEGADEGYNPNPPAKLPENLLRHAREMRTGATDAENLLWQKLRNRGLADAKFRRQHPIGKYIADFYCDSHRLVIELDGGQHAEQKSYDDQRTEYLKKQGLTILRFWNNQVLNETESVLQVIWDHVADSETLTPGPSPAIGRGGDGALTPTPLPLAGEGLKEWEVPFDFPEEWPEAARKPFDAFHAARQAMQRQMDASIAAHADQETLYDQPAVSKNKLRITGPFTVEAVPFPSVLGLEPSHSPGGRGGFDFEADVAVARSGETSRQGQWRDELLKTGIRGKGGQKLKLADLEPLPGARFIHAVGTIADDPSPQPISQGERGLQRIAVSFGPEHAALEQRQVEIAMREAGELFPLPKMLVFCAFTFDPEAAKDIDNIKGITALKVQMNTDLLTEDLKKARANNESFWLMGQPDVEVRKLPSPPVPLPKGEGSKDLYQVEVHGFDYFDTASGELKSGGKKQIAMWALDTDYDDRSLFPKQVFFPMAGAQDGWNKLKKDIKAELNEELLERFHGTVSLPFEAGENRCVAVKIVDDRGIESLKVIDLD